MSRRKLDEIAAEMEFINDKEKLENLISEQISDEAEAVKKYEELIKLTKKTNQKKLAEQFEKIKNEEYIHYETLYDILDKIA